MRFCIELSWQTKLCAVHILMFGIGLPPRFLKHWGNMGGFQQAEIQEEVYTTLLSGRDRVAEHEATQKAVAARIAKDKPVYVINYLKLMQDCCLSYLDEVHRQSVFVSILNFMCVPIIYS